MRQKLLLFCVLALSLCCRPSFACSGVAHIKKYAKPGDDVTAVLQDLVARYRTVVIDEGVWYVSTGVKLRSGVTIKGVGQGLSVIKRLDTGKLYGGMMFLTEAGRPDDYTKMLESDLYKDSMVKYHDIHFKDLTFDFNRNPGRYPASVMSVMHLYGIAFIRAEGCSVENCSFVDHMTKECNNGYPAVVLYQSRNCTVNGCTAENVTLLQAIYSKDVFTTSCSVRNSVGTAIEYVCGDGGAVTGNSVENVFWKVSCIGVNSKNVEIRNNKVRSDNPDNISSLTLGHDTPFSDASGCVVEQNDFSSPGVRSLLIQKGSGITIKNNRMDCVIGRDASELTSGCIVASGNRDAIHDIVIDGNTLQAFGEGACACVTYRGSGNVAVTNNSIKGRVGVYFLSNPESALVEGNAVEATEYSIKDGSSGHLTVRNNHLSDGIVSGSDDLVIDSNVFVNMTRPNYVAGNWNKVRAQNNVVEKAEAGVDSFLMFDASRKDDSFDASRVVVEKNTVRAGLRYETKMTGNRTKVLKSVYFNK